MGGGGRLKVLDPSVIAIYDGRSVVEDFGEFSDCIYRYQARCGWAYQRMSRYPEMRRKGLVNCEDIRKAGLCRYWNGEVDN